MQINAINSMNFKGYNSEIIDIPQEDFEVVPYDVDADIDKFEKATELTKQLVESKDMKKPIEAAVAIGYAAAKTFVGGFATASFIDGRFKTNKPSELFEKGLKQVSKGMKQVSGSLLSSDGKRISSLAKFAGSMLDKAEGLAKTAYKAISKNSATRGLAMIAGGLSLLAFFPALLKKDDNEDGVADIMQKSQSVYTQGADKMNQVKEKAGVLAELVQVLS